MRHDTADIVIDSFPGAEEAVAYMHKYARMLRQRRATQRYGVYVEPHRGAWWVMLHDRRVKR